MSDKVKVEQPKEEKKVTKQQGGKKQAEGEEGAEVTTSKNQYLGPDLTNEFQR